MDRDAKIEMVHHEVCKAIRVVRKDKSLKTDEQRLSAIIGIVSAFFPDDLGWLEPIIIQIVKFAYNIHTGKVSIKNGCCC